IGGIVSGVPGGVPGPGFSSSASVTPRKGSGPDTTMIGKPLAGYMVNGLSDQSRNDLLARLPLHQGDILADDSFDRVVKAVHDFDEHLTVGRMFKADGEFFIMITAPGADFRASMAASAGGVTVMPSTAAPPPPGVKRITIGGNVQQAKLV